jgi:hypothetical protein
MRRAGRMLAQGRAGRLVIGLDNKFDVQLGARIIAVLGSKHT